MSMTKLDAGQVIKTVFDEATGTLKTSAASGTFEVSIDSTSDSIATRPMNVDNTTLFNAVSASSNQTSSAVNILNYKGYFVSLSWTGLTSADATISIQVSVDDSTYHTVASSTTTLSSTPGSEGLEVDVANYKYFKLVYTKNTNAGGTITAKYVLKA